jgi:hypothetical protein
MINPERDEFINNEYDRRSYNRLQLAPNVCHIEKESNPYSIAEKNATFEQSFDEMVNISKLIHTKLNIICDTHRMRWQRSK